MRKNDDYLPGVYVTHEKYGRGRVLKLEKRENNAFIVVSFANYGIKKFLKDSSALKIEKPDNSDITGDDWQ